MSAADNIADTAECFVDIADGGIASVSPTGDSRVYLVVSEGRVIGGGSLETALVKLTPDEARNLALILVNTADAADPPPSWLDPEADHPVYTGSPE